MDIPHSSKSRPSYELLRKYSYWDHRNPIRSEAIQKQDGGETNLANQGVAIADTITLGIRSVLTIAQAVPYLFA